MATKKKVVTPNRYIVAYQKGMVGPYRGESVGDVDSLWRPEDYSKRLKKLSVDRIAGWLKKQGWSVVPADRFVNLWRLAVEGRVPVYIELPTTNKPVDFALRMNEVVEGVAIAMGWRGWEAFEFLSKL